MTTKTQVPADAIEAQPILAASPLPTNVIAAIARVEAEIGGIAKITPAERARRNGGTFGEGINYAYRSIDQIAAEAQPLFGKYGVVMVPLVSDKECRTIPTRNNSTMNEWVVTVDWTIYGPGGVDDKIQATTIGESRDSGDKGLNKAMTGAFKNLLLRILCIGDPNDDPDHYDTSGSSRSDDDIQEPSGDLAAYQSSINALSPPQKKALLKFGSTLGVRGLGAPGDQLANMQRAVTNILAGREPHDDGTGDDPVTVDAPEPQPEQTITADVHDHEYRNGSCVTCGKEEPF